jgi:hypothetical protein
MKDKTQATVTVKDTNAAKESKQLLDIISEVKTVATALSHFIEKHAWLLSVGSVEDLEIMVNSLECIYMGSKKQTAKVSRVSYLLKAYDKCQKAGMKRKRDTEPRRIVQGKAAMRDLKAFVKRQKTMEITPLKERINNYSTPRRYYNPPSERTPGRRSGRGHISPNKVDPFAIDTFTGKPPGRDEMWRKESLIKLLDELQIRNIQLAPFTKKIVEKGKSDFKSHDGICKMYRTWKSSGKVREPGRPINIKVKEAVVATKDALMSCSHDSSAFKLVHMKDALINEKKNQAEEDGTTPSIIFYNETKR